jgi:hypothetical protein
METKIRSHWTRPLRAAGLWSVAAVIGILAMGWGILNLVTDPTSGFLILPLLRIGAGGLSLLCAFGSSRREPWSAVGQFLATILLLGNLSVSWYSVPSLFLSLGLLVAAYLLSLTMSIVVRAPRFWTACVLGFGLACVSFFVQMEGPSMGIYGTECLDQPQGYCIGPLLGAGFPFQYVLDFPGITVTGALGWEDNFYPLLFLVDAGIYAVLAYGGWFLWRMARENRAIAHPGAP